MHGSQSQSRTKFDKMSDQTNKPGSSKVLVLPALKKPLSLESHPVPSPTLGSAVVRVLTTVIRPHQRAGFEGKSPLSFPTPYTPGHTAIARVITTGADAVRIRPGQLVYVDGFLSGRDDADSHGQTIIGLLDGFTPESKELFKVWGGLWRNIATVPLEQCYVLDEQALTAKGYGFSDMQMIERLALAYAGYCAAHLKPGQTVIVAPASGNFSGAMAEVAAQLGCKVIALTRSAPKLEALVARHPSVVPIEVKGTEDETAAAIRAACPPAGAHAYIDVSPPLPGSAVTHFKPCLSAVRAHGQVVLLGMLLDVHLDSISVLTKSLTIKGQWMYTRQQIAETIHLVESGILKLGKEAGHEVMGEFRLEDWKEAVEKAESVLGWGQQILFTPLS